MFEYYEECDKDFSELDRETYGSNEWIVAECDYLLCLHVYDKLSPYTFDDHRYCQVIRHGGSIAVYRECVRQNKTIDELLNTGETPLTLEAAFDDDQEAVDECIAKLRCAKDMATAIMQGDIEEAERLNTHA